MAADIDAILKLPVRERLAIMEKIRESLIGSFPENEQEINIARERYEDYNRNPEDSLDWSDVKEKLFLKYGLENKV